MGFSKIKIALKIIENCHPIDTKKMEVIEGLAQECLDGADRLFRYEETPRYARSRDALSRAHPAGRVSIRVWEAMTYKAANETRWQAEVIVQSKDEHCLFVSPPVGTIELAELHALLQSRL